ncbi:MAG: hypothetical protein QNK92_02980 [Amylibacter sp.]
MGLSNVLNSTFVVLTLGTGVVSAEDLVLMVGNEAYRNFNPVANARAVLGTASAFEAAGYQVNEVADAPESQMKSALDQFERLHGDADRVVVVLSGQFMKTESSTWFAPTDLQ